LVETSKEQRAVREQKIFDQTQIVTCPFDEIDMFEPGSHDGGHSAFCIGLDADQLARHLDHLGRETAKPFEADWQRLHRLHGAIE